MKWPFLPTKVKIKHVFQSQPTRRGWKDTGMVHLVTPNSIPSNQPLAFNTQFLKRGSKSMYPFTSIACWLVCSLATCFIFSWHYMDTISIYTRGYGSYESLMNLPTASRGWVISDSICLAVAILPLSLPQSSSAKCVRERGRQAWSQSRALFKDLLVLRDSHIDSRIKAAVRIVSFAQTYGVWLKE